MFPLFANHFPLVLAVTLPILTELVYYPSLSFCTNNQKTCFHARGLMSSMPDFEVQGFLYHSVVGIL